VPCAVANPTVSYVPPNLVFVLDKSGSMTSNSIGGQTRWALLHDVVSAVTAEFEGRVKFGSKLYPSASTGCSVNQGVDVAPTVTFSQNIANGDIPARGASFQSTALTPLYDGVRFAGDWLKANLVGETKGLILVADGQISGSCNGDSTQANNYIRDLHDNFGIPTFVVGIDISGTADTDMRNYAQSGGRPGPGNTYYNSTNQQALFDAMNAIVESIVTCEIDLGSAPPFPELTEILVDGVRYVYDPALDCATQDGFVFVPGSNNQTVELCGAACDAFKAQAMPTATVEFYCTAG
jgi:hypothetical protein